MRTVVLSGLALVVLAGSGSAGPATAPPRRAVDRHAAIAAVERALDDLAREAAVPAALARVRTYARYTTDQLADTNRGVDVDDVLAIVKDEGLDAVVRQEAASALITETAKNFDPHLSQAGRGLRRPRATFSRKVLSVLVDKDLVSRAMAKKILDGLWDARDPEITVCNPRNRPSCTAARVAWERFLQK